MPRSLYQLLFYCNLFCTSLISANISTLFEVFINAEYGRGRVNIPVSSSALSKAINGEETFVHKRIVQYREIIPYADKAFDP